MNVGPYDIENFIPNRNINLNGGGYNCDDYNFSLLSNITLQESGRSQVYKVNFPNTFTIKDMKEITNEIQTFTTTYTNGLPSHNDYENRYKTKNSGYIKFLLQITKLSNNDKDKIKETYLQAYYTNDVKLKIRFSKTLLSKLFLGINNSAFYHFGNNKEIVLDVYNPNVLGIRNKSNNPVKIIFKPR